MISINETSLKCLLQTYIVCANNFSSCQCHIKIPCLCGFLYRYFFDKFLYRYHGCPSVDFLDIQSFYDLSKKLIQISSISGVGMLPDFVLLVNMWIKRIYTVWNPKFMLIVINLWCNGKLIQISSISGVGMLPHSVLLVIMWIKRF